VTARAIQALAYTASVAAFLCRAVAAGFEASDRALSTYEVECPDFVPDWCDDGSAQ
jgi:hypothetical protein